ncbi:MAG: hypothetical protein FJZ96_07730 [Chloroflexi bacterium]|nr:hypothetical protein [Chloroflexota bacterium]
MKPGTIRLFSFILPILTTVLAILFLLIAFLPYDLLREMGDTLAKDGQLESLTPELVSRLHQPAIIIALFLFLASGLAFVFHRRFSKFLDVASQHVQAALSYFKRDSSMFWKDVKSIRIHRHEGIILALIIAVGFGLRALLLDRSVEFDEAYTLISFARRGFSKIVSDYHVPNNHVLHTILVRVSYLLLGDEIWKIRLPAFLAGLLVIPATYLLGRILYNRETGLVASGIVATLPLMALQSSIARGYPVLALLTLASFILAAYLIRKRNLLAWSLLVLFCALGFYTVPTMLYPFGVLFFWLFLSVVDINKEQYSLWSWIKHLLHAGISTAILTVVLYLPIMLNQNVFSLYTTSSVMKPLDMESFINMLPGKTTDLIQDWLTGLPQLITLLFVFCIAISLLRIKEISKYKVPIQFATLVAVLLLLLAQRPDTPERIWLWILPLFAIWIAYGISILMHMLRKISPIRHFVIILPILILAGLTVNGGGFSTYAANDPATEEDPYAEQITLAILPRVSSSSTIVVSACSDARYRYYFSHYGLPLTTFYDPRNPMGFEEAIIIVYTEPLDTCGWLVGQDGVETVMDVLENYGPALDALDINTLQVVEEIEYATIYRVLAAP